MQPIRHDPTLMAREQTRGLEILDAGLWCVAYDDTTLARHRAQCTNCWNQQHTRTSPRRREMQRETTALGSGQLPIPRGPTQRQAKCVGAVQHMQSTCLTARHGWPRSPKANCRGGWSLAGSTYRLSMSNALLVTLERRKPRKPRPELELEHVVKPSD